MDLVVAKIQRIKSFIYRNTEYVKGLPHRKRGEPDGEIRRAYMPWIFQTVPGSYQFFWYPYKLPINQMHPMLICLGSKLWTSHLTYCKSVLNPLKRVGPLVNQSVLVRAVQTGDQMHFIDI